MSRFSCRAAALVVWLLSTSMLVGADTLPAERFTLSVNGSGRATGYHESNKIITHDGKTHVTWLDSVAEGFRVRIRTLDHATGTWSPTYTIGSAHDNHGGPALTIDGDGYLHVVYGPHHHPFRYRQSSAPNDASSWQAEQTFASKGTYPTLLCGPDNTLYLTCRESTRNPWVLNMYTKPADGDWSAPRSLLQTTATGYSQYQAALAWGPNHQTMHLSTRLYNDGYAKAIGYMKSDDFGNTWTTHDGTPIGLPGTIDTVDLLTQAPAALRANYAIGASISGGAMAVDADGRPWIFYAELADGGQLPTQLWLAHPDESGNWRKQAVVPDSSIAPDGWSLGVSNGIAFDAQGRMHLTTMLVDPDVHRDLFIHPSSEVVRLVSDDGGETFFTELISGWDPTTPNWLPNIERPTGFNTYDAPGMIYTYGEKGASNSDILSNEVIWVAGTPEPSSLGLLLPGALVLTTRRRRRHA